MDCIFCKIIDGDIPSRKIFEDDKIMAFLDVNPHKPGHTLIVPKKHTTDIFNIDDDTLMYIMNHSRNIAKLLMDKLGAEGFTLIQNNGFIQEVKHFHLHIIPQYKGEIKMDIDEVFKKITVK